MQAYMKSAMPYYGVYAGGQERIFKLVFSHLKIRNFEDWNETVLTLWREARYREERYGAIALSGHPLFQEFQTTRSMPLYEEMIVDGAWWDYVDTVAVHRIGGLVSRYPKSIGSQMVAWSKSPHLWKRRTSIICQVARKKETDLRLLYTCIENNFDDREFFIRKAIGWALRAYAWVEPTEIDRYVKKHESALSNLSRKEALKNIDRMIASRRKVGERGLEPPRAVKPTGT